MDNLRREQLISYWNSEDVDDDYDWRDDLTPEELDFVASLDNRYERGILAAASAILVMDQIRAKFNPAAISELKAIGDHCRLRLRDGRLYLARLTSNNTLRLDELNEVC